VTVAAKNSMGVTWLSDGGGRRLDIHNLLAALSAARNVVRQVALGDGGPRAAW
jgi:hypothetical protein